MCLFLKATINQLRAELAKGPQEVAVYVQELQKCRTSITELTQKNQVRIILTLAYPQVSFNNRDPTLQVLS